MPENLIYLETDERRIADTFGTYFSIKRKNRLTAAVFVFRKKKIILSPQS